MKAASKKTVTEPLPDDPCKVLEEVIGEPYEESRDEKRALEWLMRRAIR